MSSNFHSRSNTFINFTKWFEEQIIVLENINDVF